jgi:hypothetical protein
VSSSAAPVGSERITPKWWELCCGRRAYTWLSARGLTQDPTAQSRSHGAETSVAGSNNQVVRYATSALVAAGGCRPCAHSLQPRAAASSRRNQTNGPRGRWRYRSDITHRNAPECKQRRLARDPARDPPPGPAVRAHVPKRTLRALLGPDAASRAVSRTIRRCLRCVDRHSVSALGSSTGAWHTKSKQT